MHDPAEGTSRGLLVALETAALVGLLVAVGSFALHAFPAASFPWDLDYGEGYLLRQAISLAAGESPYASIDDAPYVLGNYPPLYPWLLSWPARGGDPSFAWGRGLSLAATIGIAFCLYALTRSFGGGVRTGVVSGLLFLSSPFVYEWAPLHRVDMLAVFFAIAGLLLVRTRSPAWASPAFTFALLTKQTMIFAPLAVVGWLLIQRRARTAILFAMLALGIPGLLYLALHALTGGEFLRHTILYNSNHPFSWELLRVFAKDTFRLHPVLLGFGLFVGLRRAAIRRFDLVAWYLALAFVSFLLGGKVGATANYALELLVALSLAFGVGSSELANDDSTDGRNWRLLVASLILVHAALALQIPGRDEIAPTPDAAYGERAERVARLVRTANGPCLAEHGGLLLRTGKEIVYQPFVLTLLAEAGLWDPAPIVRELEERRFALVVLAFDVQRERHRLFPEAFHDAMRRNYEVLDIVAGPGGRPRQLGTWWNYWIYRPITAPSR